MFPRNFCKNSNFSFLNSFSFFSLSFFKIVINRLSFLFSKLYSLNNHIHLWNVLFFLVNAFSRAVKMNINKYFSNSSYIFRILSFGNGITEKNAKKYSYNKSIYIKYNKKITEIYFCFLLFQAERNLGFEKQNS